MPPSGTLAIVTVDSLALETLATGTRFCGDLIQPGISRAGNSGRLSAVVMSG
jgi:hypothetical protein